MKKKEIANLIENGLTNFEEFQSIYPEVSKAEFEECFNKLQLKKASQESEAILKAEKAKAKEEKQLQLEKDRKDKLEQKNAFIKAQQEKYAGYELDQKGLPKATTMNCITYLESEPEFAGKFAYNEYTCQREFDGKEYNDFIMNHIYACIDSALGIRNKSIIDVAVSELFSNNSYNPVVDYLNTLVWDGEERIETLFIKLLGAEDTKLNRIMTKKWFLAAYKRAIHPGCKFDNMIVLRGGQGIGKSTICEKISKGFWSTITLSEIGSKDLVDKLNSTWIAVIDELADFNKREMSDIKTFLSKPSDKARLAYLRNTQTYNRHCVFIGSTNDETFLRDTTSSVERRFWVIDCRNTKINEQAFAEFTPEFINQIWAEAKACYTEDTYLDIESEYQKDFAELQSNFKTYNDDFASDYIREIVEHAYDNPQSSQEMLQQFNNTTQYNGTKLDKIPASWIVYILKERFHEVRSQKYIAQVLSNKWSYATIRVGDDVCKGFRRLNTNAVQSEINF